VNVLGLAGVSTRIKVIQPPQFSAVGDPALAKVAPLGANRDLRAHGTGAHPVVGRPVADQYRSADGQHAVEPGGGIGQYAAGTGLPPRQLYPDRPAILPNGLNLDVALEAGVGSSYVTDYSCASPASKSLTATTNISTVQVKVGQIDDSIWLSSSPAPSLSPLTLVDIGSKTCHAGDLRRANAVRRWRQRNHDRQPDRRHQRAQLHLCQPP
jgi:hypothetical protein